ncbi:MAG: hypothetical protein M1142_01195 [Patescibacteria group bacterium]|nr:hypothetical protein [Patescibacteria group bacterium]
MQLLFTNIYLFAMAAVLAILEIQIEGKHGWVKNLPTWRPKSHNFWVKLYSKMMSGKEMTGYHLTMFSFVFLIFGLPYVFGLPLTLENLLKTVSFYFIFCILWDFLWFVLNPHYPLKQFKKEHLDFHHKKWLWGVPTDYISGTIVSLVVLLPVYFKDPAILSWWGMNCGLFLIQTGIVIWFFLMVLKIDKWHTNKP